MSNGTPRDWEELKKLAERLRGTVRVPITDGLGAVGGGDEPDNPDEFVRTFQTPPIQHEAADAVLELIAEVDAQHRAYQAAMSALNKSGEELSQLKAERDRMAEALGKIQSIAENVQSSYDRNGPQYTFDNGTEVYEASYVLGEMEEIANHGRSALNIGEKTDG
jgi:hypothetical protein